MIIPNILEIFGAVHVSDKVILTKSIGRWNLNTSLVISLEGFLEESNSLLIIVNCHVNMVDFLNN
jgi:hypothetical protein